jgi:hypothetical protein
MRRGLTHAIALAAAAVVLAGGGCTCGSEDGGTKKSGATVADEPPSGKQLDPTAARKRTEALRKMRLAPLTLAEIEPLIPEVPGASPVGKPGVLTDGRQVKAVLCMVSPSPDTAMTQLVAAVGARGFSNVQTRPHPKSADSVTLHADKHPYQLGATVQKAATPDCPSDKGKIKVVLSYFKRVTGGAAIPAPAPTP